MDPYDTLMTAVANIHQLDSNLHSLIVAHNQMAKKVQEQGQAIDVLIEGLNNSNKANEILLRDLASNIAKNLKEVK